MSVRLGAAASWVDPAKSAESFESDFITFLGKAFCLTGSENSSASRTDVLLQSVIANADPSTRSILDLCCGWPLLLEHLLAQLRKNAGPTAPYHYVACDRDAGKEEFLHKLDQLREGETPPSVNIYPATSGAGVNVYPVTADVADVKGLPASLRARFDGTYDLILFSYALHEINPDIVPELLFTLVELLRDGGQLVLVDPEPSWLLDAERWSETLHQLEKLKIDWEASAVWLPETLYGSILTDFGCQVNYVNVTHRRQDFYVLQAHRSPDFATTKRDQLIAAAISRLKQELQKQIYSQDRRYVSCRRELNAELSLFGSLNRHRLHKAVEFFSICASQARRLEVIRKLS